MNTLTWHRLACVCGQVHAVLNDTRVICICGRTAFVDATFPLASDEDFERDEQWDDR